MNSYEFTDVVSNYLCDKCKTCKCRVVIQPIQPIQPVLPSVPISTSQSSRQSEIEKLRFDYAKMLTTACSVDQISKQLIEIKSMLEHINTNTERLSNDEETKFDNPQPDVNDESVCDTPCIDIIELPLSQSHIPIISNMTLKVENFPYHRVQVMFNFPFQSAKFYIENKTYSIVSPYYDHSRKAYFPLLSDQLPIDTYLKYINNEKKVIHKNIFNEGIKYYKENRLEPFNYYANLMKSILRRLYNEKRPYEFYGDFVRGVFYQRAQ